MPAECSKLLSRKGIPEARGFIIGYCDDPRSFWAKYSVPYPAFVPCKNDFSACLQYCPSAPTIKFMNKLEFGIIGKQCAGDNIANRPFGETISKRLLRRGH